MKKIIQVVMFLSLAGYIHATMVSGQAGYILVINADGSINAVISGTSSVIASSNTFHGTFYQGVGEDWKVNFDSTTGAVAIYFTGSLPAGTNNIGDVDIASASSDTTKVGSEIMNWLADYPDAALLAALITASKNIVITSGTISEILDLICSSDNAKVAAEIMNFPVDYPDSAVLAAIISGFKNVVISSGDVNVEQSSGTSGVASYQPAGHSYNVNFSTVNIRALCGATTKWVDIRTESCGSPNLRMAIYSGEQKFNILSISDGDSAGFYGGLVNSRLQAYNTTGNVFDRLRLDGTDFYRSLWVRTSTNSHTQVDNFPTNYNTDGSSVTVKDERYEGKKSTHTAGKLNASGNIPSTDFDVTAWAFFSDGSDSTVTGLGGTSYCLNNVGNSSPPLELHFASPTMAVTLGTGGTFYYEVWGSTQ